MNVPSAADRAGGGASSQPKVRPKSLERAWILGSISVGLVSLGLATLGGCSLTIDEAGLAGPDLNCSEVEKQCDVDGDPICAPQSSPDYGCANATCAPCYLNKATATCSPGSGECIVAACIGSWENCDRIDANGCEIDLNTDPDHCGGCGKACPPRPHAEVRCGGAHCYIRVCEDGFADCNDEVEDGCETALDTTPDHVCTN